MMFTRRQIVSGIALSSCAVILGSGPGTSSTGRIGRTLGRWLGLGPRSARDYTPQLAESGVGRKFRLTPEEGPGFDAVLREVVGHRRDRVENGRVCEQYTLVFEGPRSEEITQGNFVVSDPREGDFRLFVVPTSTQGKRRDYEASFTRLV